MEGKNLTTIDKNTRSGGGRSLRDDVGQGDAVVTPGRSIDKLTRVDSQGKDKPTIRSADRGEGRYAIKGDDKKLRDETKSSGRKLETLGNKPQRSTPLESGSSKDAGVKNETVSRLDRGAKGSESDLKGRVTETTRSVSRQATGAESTGDKVNRYVQMKQAQGSTGGSRGNRTTASKTRMATAPREATGTKSESAPSSSGRSVKKSSDSAPAAKAAPSTGTSAPKSVSRGSQRSTGSVSSPSKGGSRISSGSPTRGGSGGSRSGSRGGRR